MDDPDKRPPPQNSLITPSASPPISRTFFPPPYRGPPPQKRPRIASSSSSSTPIHSRSTPSFTDPTFDLHDARRQSSLRVLSVWSQLAERYTRAIDDDDIVDLRTGDLVKDRGFLRAAKQDYDIGFFADADADSEGAGASEGAQTEGEDDDIDELDAFAGGPDTDVEGELDMPEREVPPVRPVDPADAEDLREFLEAERRRREECGSEGEDENEVEDWTRGSVLGETEGSEDDEGGYDENEGEVLSDGVAGEVYTDVEAILNDVGDDKDRDDDFEQGEITSSLDADPDATDLESDDELGAWNHDEGSAVYHVDKDSEDEEDVIIVPTSSPSPPPPLSSPRRGRPRTKSRDPGPSLTPSSPSSPKSKTKPRANSRSPSKSKSRTRQERLSSPRPVSPPVRFSSSPPLPMPKSPPQPKLRKPRTPSLSPSPPPVSSLLQFQLHTPPLSHSLSQSSFTPDITANVNSTTQSVVDTIAKRPRPTPRPRYKGTKASLPSLSTSTAVAFSSSSLNPLPTPSTSSAAPMLPPRIPSPTLTIPSAPSVQASMIDLTRPPKPKLPVPKPTLNPDSDSKSTTTAKPKTKQRMRAEVVITRKPSYTRPPSRPATAVIINDDDPDSNSKDKGKGKAKEISVESDDPLAITLLDSGAEDGSVDVKHGREQIYKPQMIGRSQGTKRKRVVFSASASADDRGWSSGNYEDEEPPGPGSTKDVRGSRDEKGQTDAGRRKPEDSTFISTASTANSHNHSGSSQVPSHPHIPSDLHFPPYHPYSHPPYTPHHAHTPPGQHPPALPPPQYPIQGAQAQFLIAQAMHHLSYLMSATGAPPGWQQNTYTPRHQRHPEASGSSSPYATPTTHSSAALFTTPTHPHPYPHTFTPSQSGATLPPSSPPPSSSPVAESSRTGPRAPSLVRGRSKSRGRRVSFQLSDHNPRREEEVDIVDLTSSPERGRDTAKGRSRSVKSSSSSRPASANTGKGKGKARTRGLSDEESDSEVPVRRFERGQTPGPPGPLSQLPSSSPPPPSSPPLMRHRARGRSILKS